jgi:hypothetical protein
MVLFIGFLTRKLLSGILNFWPQKPGCSPMISFFSPNFYCPIIGETLALAFASNIDFIKQLPNKQIF